MGAKRMCRFTELHIGQHSLTLQQATTRQGDNVMRLLCDKIQQKFVPQRNNGFLGNIEQYNVTGDNLLALKWCPPLVATVVACAHGSAQKNLCFRSASSARSHRVVPVLAVFYLHLRRDFRKCSKFLRRCVLL